MKFRTIFRKMLGSLLAACLLQAWPACGDSSDIRVLQERLIALGYEIGAADGIAGAKTSAAVTLAQTLLADAGYDIRPTGQPDTRTAELIMQEQNKELLRTLLRSQTPLSTHSTCLSSAVSSIL